ncbi:beta-lactamase family protein [Paenibacillus sp. 7124]|uniref:Beta-lactamase family protein n=1 Tax=Paenibacillus apii TaxID=1850370 RepID=A0A6M1PNQ3_9BACL|nr:serine hydrolase domain-containing protein [Paenibacillus apii]NGM83832.1 beta-lactamase family protein [Paenibacillus apii]NJJ40639.1 beta-lactamase family protein [Paenibacillus apii]
MNLQLKDIFPKICGDNTPGMGVIANHKGQIVYQDTIGLANCEHNIPINIDTVFNLASISKQFTGMAILQLIEKGEICPSDKITKYIPEVRHYAGDVTIYQLSHHSAGLIDYNELLWQKARNNSLYSSNTEVLNLLKNENSLCFVPGSKFDYSNSNYVMLAIIIERITGLTLRDYLKQYIFDIIGMQNTTVFNEEQPIVPHRAYGYEKSGEYWKCFYADTFATGCANVFSSLLDLKKWDDALYDDSLLKEETKRTIFEAGLDSSGNPLTEFWGGYSYGWMIQERCGEKTIWHTGGDAGFRSIIVRFYEKEFSVILLCNFANLDWQDTYKLIESLFKEFSY